MLFTEVNKISDVAMNILRKRYFSPGETKWEDIVNRVIDYVLIDCLDKDQKELTREMMMNRYFIPNSPCLVNSNKKDAGLCACFVVDFPDTIEGIFKTKLDFALIARKGGGCGTTLSKIRPEGAKVNGSTHGYAGGPINFFDTICKDMEVVSQGGFRSMAMMGSMSCYSPDIIKFINSKTEEGKMSTTNISVLVDDKFMQAVEEDKSYWTYFDFEREGLASNRIYYTEHKARTVFNLIVEGAWKNGEPGILFYNAMNNSPYKYSGQKLVTCNPCFTADTLILTDDGYEQIGFVSNFEKYNLVDAEGRVVEGKARSTGIKKVYILNLSTNKKIKCTADHVFMSVTGDEIKAIDTKGIQLRPYLKYSELDNYFTLLGFIQEDGDLGRLKSDKHLGVEVNIGQKDQDILKLLVGHKYTSGSRKVYLQDIKENLIKEGFDSNKLPERAFPYEYANWDHNQRASFLRGCFSANGCINSYGRITYKATSKKFIEQLKGNLEVHFGIYSYITTNKTHPVKFSNGTYTVKESYDLNIADFESKTKFFNEINFYQQYKVDKLQSLLNEMAPFVQSIKYSGEEEVFDFSLPDYHWGVIEGVVAHNCGEVALPFNGVCNLGSLDIVKFLRGNGLDLNLLATAVKLSVRFLDQVVTKSYYPTQEITDWVKDNSPIGLGIMGFADYLLRKKIAYGSDGSLQELEFILSFMYRIAEDESIRLGEELGVPKNCSVLPIPRRNITLLSIAPTGTISLLADCSSSIEPIFSEITIRNDKTGSYSFNNISSDMDYFRCAVSANGAKEVTWEEHVKVQAAAQKWVDSGVSKTINFPTHTHRDTIANSFMLAWKLGCKGITVYRNNSRRVEVLSPKNLKKDKCPVCGKDVIKESSCTKCTDINCGWSLCSA